MNMGSEFLTRSATVETLKQEVRRFREAGYRLVQISATRAPNEVELTYSFDKESRLEHLRVFVAANGAVVPSITSIYWCAFLYENELHDLFDVRVDGNAVDFHGSFYKTAIQFPFGGTKVPLPPSADAKNGNGASRPTHVEVKGTNTN